MLLSNYLKPVMLMLEMNITLQFHLSLYKPDLHFICETFALNKTADTLMGLEHMLAIVVLRLEFPL